MKRGRRRSISKAEVRKRVDALIKAQERTGVTMIDIRPTDDPDVYECNPAPGWKLVKDAFALMATGMSREQAIRAVVEKAKQKRAS